MIILYSCFLFLLSFKLKIYAFFQLGFGCSTRAMPLDLSYFQIQRKCDTKLQEREVLSNCFTHAILTSSNLIIYLLSFYLPSHITSSSFNFSLFLLFRKQMGAFPIVTEALLCSRTGIYWRVATPDLHSLSSILSLLDIVSLPRLFSLQNLRLFKCLLSSNFSRYSLLFLIYCTCLVVQESLNQQTTISPMFPNFV